MGKWMVLGLAATLVAGAANAAAVRSDNAAAVSPPAVVSPPNERHNGEVGVFATMNGRSADLATPDRVWNVEPNVRQGDVEAGFGWRNDDGGEAVLGYSQPDLGHHSADIPPPPIDRGDIDGPGGLFGVGFAIHTP